MLSEMGLSEHDLALLARPDLLRLLDEDRTRSVEMPIETTRGTAADDLAYLAVYRARHALDRDEPQAQIPHSRFVEAVAAAREAPDEDRAWEAARQFFGDDDAFSALEAMDQALRGFSEHPLSYSDNLCSEKP